MKISLLGLLFILFIALKLTNIITWSWIWVLAPIWIPIVLTFIVFILIMIVGLIILAKEKS